MPWVLAQLSRRLLKGITSRSANITHGTNRTILSHNLPCHFHFTLISPLPPQRQFQKRTNNKLWVENFRHVRQRNVRGETTKRQSRSPASPQPYCASKGNFSEDVSVPSKETIAIEEERDLPGVLRKVLLMRKMLQQLRVLQ